MQVKVSEASGRTLDYLVAKARGFTIYHNAMLNGIVKHGFWVSGYYLDPNTWVRLETVNVSTDHALGGPLMDREFISTSYDYAWVYDPDNVDPDDVPDNGDRWYAEIRRGSHDFVSDYGSTRLIAAMRCYVTSKLGLVVEVPDDLL